jgi:hypothetical protein
MKLQTLIALGCVIGLYTAEASAKPKAKNVSRQDSAKLRKLASVEKRRWNDSVTERSMRSSGDWQGRILLGLGLTDNRTNVVAAQTARGSKGQNTNASLGFNLRYRKYVYADIDGFYGGSSPRIKGYGGLGEAGARYSFGPKNVRFQPSLGIGFGYLGLEDAGTLHQVAGPYGSVGLGVLFGSRFSVTTDAAVSVEASGKYGPTVADDATFTRIRAGAFYRVSQPLTLGAQYVRRQLKSTLPGEATPISETGDQVMATFLLHF